MLYKDTSNAEGSTASTGSSQLLVDLKAQLSKAQQALTSYQAALSQLQNVRHLTIDQGGCKRKLAGWDNGCLNNNTAAQNDAQNNINHYTALIPELEKKIKEEEARIAAAAAIQIATDPALAKVHSDKAVQIAAVQSKNSYYWIIGIAVLLLAAGVTWYFVKIKKG